MGSLKDKRTRTEDPAEAQMWWPYIQPTGKEYDGFWGKNGYESFEYGYLRQDHGKLLEKKVLGEEADSFSSRVNDGLMADVVEGMHIRLFSMRPVQLKWDCEGLPMSTVGIEEGVPTI